MEELTRLERKKEELQAELEEFISEPSQREIEDELEELEEEIGSVEEQFEQYKFDGGDLHKRNGVKEIDFL